jgi:diguanylate cyclase (GGDEF)-like protein
MRHSLIRQTLQSVVVWLSVVTLVAAMLAYREVTQQQQQQALTDLEQMVDARIAASALLFEQARRATQAFSDTFVTRYRQKPPISDAFELRFQRDNAGALRSRAALFDGKWLDNRHYQHVSGFLSNRAPALTAELRQRLTATLDVLAELGPGLIGSFANVHVSLPENALLMYGPGDPWGLNARADLDMVNLSTIAATLKQNNPERHPVWSPLYFDATAEQWVITYQKPFDLDQQHLITPSIDIRLNQLIDDMLATQRPDDIKMIVHADGQIIAHPALSTRAQSSEQERQNLFANHPGLADVVAAVNKANESSESIELLSQNGQFFAVGKRMQGPPWWLVATTPRARVIAEANITAIGVLSFGLFLMLLAFTSVALVLRRRVAQPIRQLDLASQKIAAGHYASVAGGEQTLPRPNNEIARLSDAFLSMAERIRDHEQMLRDEVSARTAELETANQRLARLSQHDSLTDLLNRRRFDEDLELAVEQARERDEPFCLLMVDIDHFKQFNDHFGHQAGDRALQKIAACLAGRMRGQDRVYRYGGEELAVLLHKVDHQEGEAIGQRLLQAIRDLGLPLPPPNQGVVSASMGLAQCQAAPTSDSPDTLLKRADTALYAAKAAGRDQLVNSELLNDFGAEQGKR